MANARLVCPERRAIVLRSPQLLPPTPTGPPCRARLDLVYLKNIRILKFLIINCITFAFILALRIRTVF